VPIPCCEHRIAQNAKKAQTQFRALASLAVITAVLVRIQVFWRVRPCSWVFALKMEALLSFETTETLPQGQDGPI
jgi:hypothetical protein